MPAEDLPHARTHLTWPTRRIWFGDTRAVRRDIARLARVIAAYEPTSVLAQPGQVTAAQRACGREVDVYPGAVDDLWARDTGPTFVVGAGDIAGVDFNFNGWGGRQRHRGDRQVARQVLDHVGVQRVVAPIIAEGGALEVDGDGTLMATESSLVNDNRNPGLSRDEVEAELKSLLGVSKVIWFKGLRNHDITDCHVDAVARFAAPGLVVMSKPAPGTPPHWVSVYRQARRVLRTKTDAHGRAFELVDLPEPSDVGRRGPDFLGCYVNYYVTNGAVIIPRYGDRRADRNAKAIVRDLYPGRDVVQVAINMIAEGGGGIHCATQQEPLH